MCDECTHTGGDGATAMAVDDKCPEPLHQMDNGDSVDITGGLRGEYTYTIKKVAGNYTCS